MFLKLKPNSFGIVTFVLQYLRSQSSKLIEVLSRKAEGLDPMKPQQPSSNSEGAKFYLIADSFIR